MKRNNSASKGTVSVVMCTFNGGKFLKEQMDSILEQDFPLHEIIVQDDCSGDDTWALLQGYAKAHEGLFKLYRNSERMGFNRNFRTALLRAESEFVAVADQDDVWFPGKIRRQVEAIGHKDICFSDYFRDEVYSEHLSAYVSPPGDLVSLLFSNTIPGHTMLIRREFLQKPEAWNEGFYYDWWLLVTSWLESRGPAHVEEALNWHRPHALSAIARLHAASGRKKAAKPSWQPYIFGWRDLKRLRKLPAWQLFYNYIYTHTAEDHEPLVHQLAEAMLDERALGQLCRLCLKHRERVYPSCRGWKQKVRAFCRPAIYAYGNASFDF